MAGLARDRHTRHALTKRIGYRPAVPPGRLLGAHMSVAGGFHKAVEAAAALGMTTCQIFTKNNMQWRAQPLSEQEILQFRNAVAQHALQAPIAHAGYLINLASPNDELWRRSVAAFTVELERAEALGLIGVVVHPGSFVESSEPAGLARVVRGLNLAHGATRGFGTLTVLETTAGQGTNLGHRFEHLARIIKKVRRPERLAVCIDTCHLFAAGYPISSEEGFRATFQQFDDLVGLSRIRAFHLNDSKRGLGSRIDRHTHVGEGQLGLEAFRLLLNDARFTHLPMYLETPKGKRRGRLLDAINLRTLTALIEPGN
jgi:deoxyribonuclease-4